MTTVPPSAPTDPLPGILTTHGFHLLSGASGIGKTALIAGIARVFRDGGTLAGHPATPTPMGYIGADRSWRRSRYWFEQVGYPDIPHYCLIDDDGFAPALLKGDGAAVLETCIAHLDLPAESLIIVDPLALFLGGKLGDYTHTAIACMGVARRLLKSGRTVLGICHTSKQKGDAKDRYLRPQDRILGSAALLGYSGTQLNLMAPDESGREDDVYELLINPHEAASEVWELTKSPQTGLFDLDGVGLKGDADRLAQPLSDRAKTLHTLMVPDKPYTVPQLIDLYNDTRPSPRSVYRSLTELQRARLVDSPIYGVWRRIPSTTSTADDEAKVHLPQPEDL